ncbi:hypothetical protein LTR37_018208 [Vermiconidia calcicola]|uniref:Uncharacterized protein n=1 Tax=Vermiconidia calcicola TaxID=1690605 RepID=A0ACC3MJF6_9PEZI|nr:hypothetical protein LTR37_018208 [Vermiconidia calcicola]
MARLNCPMPGCDKNLALQKHINVRLRAHHKIPLPKGHGGDNDALHVEQRKAWREWLKSKGHPEDTRLFAADSGFDGNYSGDGDESAEDPGQAGEGGITASGIIDDGAADSETAEVGLADEVTADKREGTIENAANFETDDAIAEQQPDDQQQTTEQPTQTLAIGQQCTTGNGRILGLGLSRASDRAKLSQ